MNYAKSIREKLSIPPGISRNVGTGYSSFTDSQFLFGSQFRAENSQSLSQDMSLSSRNSQQSSQEGSDPKFASSYQTKPPLFGKSKTNCGMLDKFEEDKKKAKEKNDSDILVKECIQIRETLSYIQQLLAEKEKNECFQTVLQKLDSFSLTWQNNFSCLQNEISQQFEALLNKVNSQKEIMTELEKKVQKRGEMLPELCSNAQNIKKALDGLREEQERDKHMLEEALQLLNTLISEHSAKARPEDVMDTASQTSPRQNNTFTQFSCPSNNSDHSQVNVCPQNPIFLTGKRKSTSKVCFRRKKRPLVLSKRHKRIVSDENKPPTMSCNRKQNVLTSRSDLNRVLSTESQNPNCLSMLTRQNVASEAAGCFITPLSCWSQDSNSSTELVEINSVLENVSAESKTAMPTRAESFWQLFDMDSETF